MRLLNGYIFGLQPAVRGQKMMKQAFSCV